MSRRKVMTPAARKRAWKREMLAEIDRLQEMAAQGLAELDALFPRAPDAKRGTVLEGRIEGDTVVVDEPPATPPRRSAR
jgi:hypothetical protein